MSNFITLVNLSTNVVQYPDSVAILSGSVQYVGNITGNTITTTGFTSPTTAITVNCDLIVTGGLTVLGDNTQISTQTILAEDNNIILNYGGTHETAYQGGISVLHGVTTGTSSDFLTDTVGNWISNVGIGVLLNTGDTLSSLIDIKGTYGYSQLRLRTSYTPSGSTDTNGQIGDVAWDNNFFYWKTSGGWLRASGSTF